MVGCAAPGQRRHGQCRLLGARRHRRRALRRESEQARAIVSSSSRYLWQCSLNSNSISSKQSHQSKSFLGTLSACSKLAIGTSSPRLPAPATRAIDGGGGLPTSRSHYSDRPTGESIEGHNDDNRPTTFGCASTVTGRRSSLSISKNKSNLDSIAELCTIDRANVVMLQ